MPLLGNQDGSPSVNSEATVFGESTNTQGNVVHFFKKTVVPLSCTSVNFQPPSHFSDVHLRRPGHLFA
jgi:hypothetical protein